MSIGQFLSLQNTVFDEGGMLQKRNGFGPLASLPDSSSMFITTFNGNLTALGDTLMAYNAGTQAWGEKGAIQPLELSTLPLIRTSTNQIQADSAVASNGLVCTVYTDVVPITGTPTSLYKFVVADSITGQNITAPALITPVTGTVTGSPRVFCLGRYFIIVFTNNISGTYHLQYIAIPITNPSNVGTAVNITSLYTPASTVNFDGVVANNSLYIAWNGSDTSVKVTRIDSALTQYTVTNFAGEIATIISVTADTSASTAVIYISYYDSGSQDGFTAAVNQNLSVVLAPAQTISGDDVLNIASVANNSVCTVFYELDNKYGYDSSISTNIINNVTVTQAGVVSAVHLTSREVGLASKAFLIDNTAYLLSIYNSAYQPTYFLMDGSGNIVAKLAYSNGGSYYTLGLPGITVNGNVVQIPFLIKDLVAAVNKTQGVANTAGVYSQTGINLATFTIGTTDIATAEIGNDLHFSGGFLWMYDGYRPVEHSFHLWPDYVESTDKSTDGNLAAQQYFYQFTYEWTDNQGNIHRSAPSVPLSVDLTASMTATNTVTLTVPTLRLTYKTVNPVSIVGYRWSTAQQSYFRFTSISNPVVNDTSVDYVTIEDTLADASILGNDIIYTTGAVLENIAMPAVDSMTLFQSRLFAIDSEDKNLLWFSKQVIEATPVETSDLLTVFVAPTTGAQAQGTGPMRALSTMDDKLIIFKQDAIYYMNGTGPDNTGANSQFSEPTFITATVGSSNQKSIVFMPGGLMFESDKGIWLLGRDLSTSYIGAPVQGFTQNATVLSAINVPGTNQVRFTLSSGITLMYDYYYGQWGTFINIPAISSTLYQAKHTYLNSFGQVFQETPGRYLDGSSPVLMQFTTSWIQLAGLQGYQRAYFFYMLGEYISPHKLSVAMSYDYAQSPSQTVVITPDNYSQKYGNDTLWGSTPTWGGRASLEQWRVFFKQQQCQAFQIAVQESYDPSFGQAAGAGFTMSGINMVAGVKKGYRPIRAANSTG